MTIKGRILVVDDTPASLKLLTSLLKAEGYEVRSAISGELALYSATSNPPDLILLDIRMPEMDGFEVCRCLKAQAETRDVPIIFVSSLSEIDEKVEGFELGAVDFVTKPYQREELLLRVRTHLELQRLRHNLERLVAERTANLHHAQNIAHLGSWELDRMTGELAWSDEIFRILEIDSFKFAPSYPLFQAAIHPEDRVVTNRAASSSLIDKQPYQIVFRLLIPDGRIKWVEERCSHYFDAEGSVIRSVGTLQDVTAREEAAIQLRIAAVAFDTQEAIIVTDRNANIIKVNKAFELTTGFSEQEVLGKNPRLLKSNRHDQTFYDVMWQAIEHNGRWSGEVWDRRKSGEIYPKWLTVTAVKNSGQISHYVGVFVDMSERKQAEEEIRRLAFFDPLTLLPNRRLLLDRLQIALSQSVRSQNHGALMLMDLDHFKVINDTRGHAYGDEMLIEVAQRLTSCVRKIDTTARLGGDEFVVLLEGLSPNPEDAATQANVVAEKIRESLSQVYLISDHEFISSTSVGVVLFNAEETEIDELFKRADMAMYQAKESGRNTVRFFEPAMQIMLDSRALLENALRLALPDRELELFYQLQTNRNRELCGAEVLLRWHSKTLGMISPAQFIPLAEQTKLILPIGRWVLETACARLKQWEPNPLISGLTLAVNISPVQFHRSDFVSEVKSIIVESGANPERLKLELTENLVLEDVDEAILKMTELKAMGVRFSMDDFGTGYSSLQYLKSLPIDQLKIDQSFVHDILTDLGDAMMVQTIVNMAHNFGYEVIAEGVEEEAQIPSLIERGCEMFQGYFYSRPIPLADFEKLIDEWHI